MYKNKYYKNSKKNDFREKKETFPSKFYQKKEAFQKFEEEMEIRNFSENTKKKYKWVVKNFLEYVKVPLEQVNKDHFKKYMLSLLDKKLTTSSINMYTATLRFLGGVCLDLGSCASIIPARKAVHQMIQVLSKAEVRKILSGCRAIKERAILTLIYAAGLRSAEAANLKVEDLDGQRMLIHIRQGKGNKDRIVPFPHELRDFLREYYRQVRPKVWLFENEEGTGPMKTGAIARIWRIAKKSLGAKKIKGVHTLRHCFATHLLESGLDIRTLQVLLGHTSIMTTVRYLKVTSTMTQSANEKMDALLRA